MYYAKPYGLTRDELCYILDPNDVYARDFPGETFRVLLTEFFSQKQEEIEDGFRSYGFHVRSPFGKERRGDLRGS